MEETPKQPAGDDPVSQSLMQRGELFSLFEMVLERVDEHSASRYANAWPLMCSSANDEICSRANVQQLIGPNSISTIHTHHENHSAFMASCFNLKSAQCFVEVMIWIYGSHMARGFSENYFLADIDAWKSAVRRCLGSGPGPETILDVYNALRSAHPSFVALSAQGSSVTSDALRLDPDARRFLDALLLADERSAETMTREQMRAASADVPRWWVGVVAPALRAVGQLWAEGRITVAQEHIATAIAQRVMDRCFPILPTPPRQDFLIAVCLPPGERHDMAGRMLRDCLLAAGYEVLFTGADTPIDSIAALVRHNNVSLLIIPATMSFNLTTSRDLVRSIRNSFSDRTLPIVVGGQAYTLDENLWKKVGADVCINAVGDLLNYTAKIATSHAKQSSVGSN